MFEMIQEQQKQIIKEIQSQILSTLHRLNNDLYTFTSTDSLSKDLTELTNLLDASLNEVIEYFDQYPTLILNAINLYNHDDHRKIEIFNDAMNCKQEELIQIGEETIERPQIKAITLLNKIQTQLEAILNASSNYRILTMTISYIKDYYYESLKTQFRSLMLHYFKTTLPDFFKETLSDADLSQDDINKYAEILGAQPGDTLVALNKKQNTLLRPLHPDKTSDLPPKARLKAEEECKKITEAFTYFKENSQAIKLIGSKNSPSMNVPNSNSRAQSKPSSDGDHSQAIVPYVAPLLKNTERSSYESSSNNRMVQYQKNGTTPYIAYSYFVANCAVGTVATVSAAAILITVIAASSVVTTPLFLLGVGILATAGILATTNGAIGLKQTSELSAEQPKLLLTN